MKGKKRLSKKLSVTEGGMEMTCESNPPGWHKLLASFLIKKQPQKSVAICIFFGPNA